MFVPLLIVQKVEKGKKTEEVSFYCIELALFSCIILVDYLQFYLKWFVNFHCSFID